MEKINKKILNWLTNCPASDINFKMQLKDANLITCHEAWKDMNLSKKARKDIEIRMRKLE